MTAERCCRSKFRFETRNAPKARLTLSLLVGALFSCTGVAALPGFPRQRSARFLFHLSKTDG